MFAAQASLMQALASRVMALEVQHAAEVRTRRVVVVDQDGFERVVIDTLATSGAVTVRSTEQGRYVALRSEEHTSELQSLLRISYAVFCLKKTTKITKST